MCSNREKIMSKDGGSKNYVVALYATNKEAMAKMSSSKSNDKD